MGRFNDLPREIMLEILTRLPTESVLESKSVCKAWRGIIRLPSFSQMHLARLNSADGDSRKLGFIFLSREEGLPHFYYTECDEICQETPFSRETRVDLNPPIKNCYIVGSCNGLICFSSCVVDNRAPVYICNPITREYVILPNFQVKYSWTGFGYSSSTNEYKFVRIDLSTEDSNVGIVQVYTLGSGWRTVGKMDKNMKKIGHPTGAFANGALHWLDHSGNILAFSLTDEKFSEIPPPPPSLTRAAVPYFSLVLKALGGFITVTCYYFGGFIETWLLKKNKNNNDFSWSKELTFKIDSYLPFPFGFTKSGMLLCYENEKIYGYNSRASSSKMDVSFGKSISQAIAHTCTLVSLKELGEKDTKTMESGKSSSEETGNTDKKL